METDQYFKNLKKQVDYLYDFINKAKKKGIDPDDRIEIPLAMSMAEKVVGLVSVLYPQMQGSGIAKRILDLEKKYGKLDPAVSFIIAEEVAKQKFCGFESVLQAIDAGIRIGFAYTTLGVVSSPIEGFTNLKIGKTRDDKEYLVAYFSGPIRSAGTTASCVVLMLIDYLRELFGYSRYDPTTDEVKRCVTENIDYHERVSNLQYFPTPQEMEFLARNIPIQISGEPTTTLEVSNYKNLSRVESDYIRGGMCLIFSEGLAQKAAKGFRIYNDLKKKGFQLTGFDFLQEYLDIHKKRDSGKIKSARPTYINDIVAGRPVFGHPGNSGSFRFRYGRGRVSGFSACSVHPATMGITDGFIAIGTQLKLEKPTKGCVITSCDKVEGPIVKLFNGSVRQIFSKKEALEIYPDVEEIIYLGDILFPYSDVANRNSELLKPGYVEEWWFLDLKQKSPEEVYRDIDCYNVSYERAVELSSKYKIPMHPKFIFYWSQIDSDLLRGLILWLKNSWFDRKLILPYGRYEQEKYSSGKRALELLGVPHEVVIENVVLDKKNSFAFLTNLGIDFNFNEKTILKNIIDEKKYNSKKDVLEIINSLSKYIVKDKAGDFIGARMGRPEKAKLRKLVGSPNVLFPIGREGGRLRSLNSALEVGHVTAEFPINYCEKCEKETIYYSCEVCGQKTRKMFYFSDLKKKDFSKKIINSEKDGQRYCMQHLDVNYYFNKAVELIGIDKNQVPLLIKGVRGTFSEDHDFEHLAKGILRARYNLQVNKDGTIRFDSTELPLVAFKPKEIFVDIPKLKELGYTHDIYGNQLENKEQILELMPHDILLPSSPESRDERADDVFFSVSKFVDDELEKIYGLGKLHNLNSKEDLVGQIGVCMAPHNCAGVICRFIGFSNSLGLYASPYMHAAIRRDCDGDEMAVMLLSDVLLNFSRKFLPSHRGGTQDAPLVLNAKIDAGEVDDQILDFEFCREYPIELYQLSEQGEHSSEIKNIKNVKNILKNKENPFKGIWFTHDTFDFNEGVLCSNYKLLNTMPEKVKHQMELCDKIRAVDERDTARLIIDRHFMRDIRGNLRKFSMQGFRCVDCNYIMRRPPLIGICPVCKGKIIFTIHEGGIKKYLDPAIELANTYQLSPYIKQTLELTKETLDSIFGKETEKQEALKKWF